jgi:hypothetical protein
MEEADKMEDIVVAEAHRMTSNQYRNAKEVSFFYKLYPNHKIQKLDQWLGIWSHFLKNFSAIIIFKEPY